MAARSPACVAQYPKPPEVSSRPTDPCGTGCRMGGRAFSLHRPIYNCWGMQLATRWVTLEGRFFQNSNRGNDNIRRRVLVTTCAMLVRPRKWESGLGYRMYHGFAAQALQPTVGGGRVQGKYAAQRAGYLPDLRSAVSHAGGCWAQKWLP